MGSAWMKRCLWLLGGALGGASLGCFNGEDAAGLPCDDDRDCGLGQRCTLGFCGGPGDEGCGNGAVEGDEECDNGPDNDDAASCTSECRFNVCGDGKVGPGEACDDGNRIDNDGCSNACTLPSCGDGKIDPGEACDDGGQNGDSSACTNSCQLNVCGDGLVHAGVEACDTGGESAACNANCTLPRCGDGIVNAAYGEACDLGGAPSSAQCMDNCTRPLLWDDVESVIDGYDIWQDPGNGDGYTSNWVRSVAKSNSGANAWSSGARDPQGAFFDQYQGSTRLESPVIDLEGVEGPVRLRFVHRWAFEDTGDPNWESDGAALEVLVGGSWQLIEPDGGYPHLLEDEDGCEARSTAEPNPRVGTPAWSHASPGGPDAFVPATFDLTPFVGEQIRLGFHVSYDCSDDVGQVTEGWFVDDIVVWRPIVLGE